ncbi:MAG: ATP-binding protein [Pseudomonadota bacterium]
MRPMSVGFKLRTLLFATLLALGLMPAAVLLLSLLPGAVHAYREAALQHSLMQAQTQARELTQRLERRRETVRNIALLPAPLEMLKAVQGKGGGLYLTVDQAAERFVGVLRRWFTPPGDLEVLVITDLDGIERLRLEVADQKLAAVPVASLPRHDLGDRFPRLLAGDPRHPQAFVLTGTQRLRIAAPIKALDGAVAGSLIMDFDLHDVLREYAGSRWVDGYGRDLHGSGAPGVVGVGPGTPRQPTVRGDAQGVDVAWVPLALGPEPEDVMWVGTPVDQTPLRTGLMTMVAVTGAVFLALAVGVGLGVRRLVARLEGAKADLVDGLHRMMAGERGVRFDWAGPAELRAFCKELTQLGDAHASALQALRLTRFSIEHAKESVFWLGGDGRIFFVNDAASTMLGYDRDELVGMEAGKINPDHSGTRWADHWNELTTTGTVVFEAELRRKDGSTVPVEVVANHLVFEGQDYDLAFVRDVSERKAADERLRATMDELTRSNVELERFAYVAAHDLQEPVRTVVSFAQLIERRARDRLIEDEREFLDYLVSGAKRMQDLVKDLLSYSRVRHRDAPLGTVSLDEALAEAVANLQGLIGERDARIDAGPLPTVAGDMIQMVEVFQNLLSNAIKFSRPGVTPEIRVRASFEDGRWAISVADNGIGVDPAYAEQVFTIFTRLHGAQYPGTGIGLAVCKRIIERHGGSIRVAETPGGGATVIFTVPEVTGGQNPPTLG